jgi:hypothetical protein
MQARISGDEKASPHWTSRRGGHFEQTRSCYAVEAGNFGSAGEGKGYISNHQESHQAYRASNEHLRFRSHLRVASAWSFNPARSNSFHVGSRGIRRRVRERRKALKGRWNACNRLSDEEAKAE